MGNSNNANTNELPEEVEMVGPGKRLAEAREKMGLSTQQVADKLNFRLSLVNNIEADIYDRTLPATYNRGYLKNYAKLVKVPAAEVLASYEMISEVDMKGTELQSFSKETEKQAENNRLMWVSYLILALLIGSTLMWWLQDGDLNVSNISNDITQENVSRNDLPESINNAVETTTNTESNIEIDLTLVSSLDNNESANDLVDPPVDNHNNVNTPSLLESTSVSEAEPVLADNEPSSSTQAYTAIDVSFTFLGDCWVNIYDDRGERIAWGIKKAGYEMNISGKAPFSITLGKPELVSIVYDGNDVDMTQFNRGNIAKFTLPLE